MGLARIDLVLETDWMAELIDRIDFAADASLDHFAHSTQVAIEKIHMMSSITSHPPPLTPAHQAPGGVIKPRV